MMRNFVMVVGVAGLLAATGCQKAYYGAMEKVGVHKRDIMVDRVKDARSAQEEAKESFKTTLEQFADVVEIKSGDLEKTYNRLNTAFEKSVARADAVNSRIDSVEAVSKALFKEWKAEIKAFSNPEMKKSSQAQLAAAQKQYAGLMKAMRGAAASMDPVLAQFRDQVLFLKHNLNSAAIASIEGEVVKVKSDVAKLIADMEASIAEADRFLAAWQQP
jgi:hypothetical protein